MVGVCEHDDNRGELGRGEALKAYRRSKAKDYKNSEKASEFYKKSDEKRDPASRPLQATIFIDFGSILGIPGWG